MKKTYLYIVLLFLIIFLWIYKYSLKEESNPIQYYNEFENKHNWKNISEILTKENYQKIWINPDKYNDIKDFLKELNSYSWMTINTLEESFVINLKNSEGKDMYVPFDFRNKNKNFNDKINKNLAIIDIYTAYKNSWIYWWKNSLDGQKIIFDYEMQHPSTKELNRIFSSEVNVFKYINELEKSSEIWKNNRELLAYLYDFTWKYLTWNILKKSNCEEYWCDLKNIIFDWIVLDENKKPVKWVKIEVLNDYKNYTFTDENWKYILNYNSVGFSHIRLKSSIDWYSDWFSNYSFNFFNTSEKKFNVNLNFNIHKSDYTLIINKTYDKKTWKYYIVETKNSKYFIPIESLYFENWEKYLPKDHNFKVYLYQFTKDSNMTNLLENDTFEPVYWYVWNIMKTFWMPYIQLIDINTNKELFTKSWDPMILQNQIYHMKELYENHDKIYSEITKKDMEFLVKYSNESSTPYPIDFEFLTKNNFLRWPAWWVLDRKTWIWSNIWHRVINIDWLVELPFFHIKE